MGPGAREAVFAQLADAGRAEQVAQRLTDGIVLGVLHPGERLPSEPELARRFGVALITVREGLGILREAGLVETRRGRDGGSFVVEGDAEHRSLITSRIRAFAQVELSDMAVYFGAIFGAAKEGDTAADYREGVDRGDTLVTVDVMEGQQQQEVAAVLRDAGAKKVDFYGDTGWVYPT